MTQIQIDNILDKKLKKGYKIKVPYAIIDKRIDVQVKEIQKDYKMKGFRSGQVPLDIIKQKYETSIMADESQKIINEVSKTIIDDNSLKLAITPKVEVDIFEPKKDFEYQVSMELFPDVPEIDFNKLKLVKKEVETSKKDIEEAITRVTSNYKEWNKEEESYKSKKGDKVDINYVGKIDNKEFEGGSAKNHGLELGSKSFIDNFEDQLIGKKAGDKVKVKVKFPKEYHNEKFAAKKAIFDVEVNFVSTTKDLEINDQLVKEKFGIETLEKFEEEIKKQIEFANESASKNLFKKDLFEILNKKFNFDLPEGLVEEQLSNIWSQIEEEEKKNPDKFKNDKERQKLKEEKRNISAKMVRSGIILSDLTGKNKITVNDNDILEEVNKKASQFPGQEKMVIEYYQKNPQAIEEIKGLLIEEKVIDFILNNFNIETKKISNKDLQKELGR